MQRKQYLKLGIPTPCTENWENMTPNERGRHCASCDKTIVDFSLFSDKQLIDFFRSAKGTICGRLSNTQLQRQVIYTEPQNHFLHKLLFGSALTIGLAGSANGNYIPTQKPLIEQYVVLKENSKESVSSDGGDSLHNYIKGILTDSSNKEVLPFAAILVTHNGTHVDSTYTDINGYYKIIIPDSLLKSKLILSTSYPGYSGFRKEFIASEIKYDLNISIKGTAELYPVGIIVHTEDAPFDNSNGWDKQTLRRRDTPYR